MANSMNDKKDSKDPKDQVKDQPKDGKLSDTIKKIIGAGSASDISKEFINTALGQVLKAKEDITLKASHEIITLIQKIDFVKEFSKFAENHKFKISAEIEVIKKDEPAK